MSNAATSLSRRIWINAPWKNHETIYSKYYINSSGYGGLAANFCNQLNFICET